MYLLKPTAGKVVLLIAAAALALAACSPKTPENPSAPTVDPNTIYTAAAQTVEARLTEDAAKAPPTVAPTATIAIPTADLSLPTLAVPGSQPEQSTPSGAAAPQAVASLTPIATSAVVVAPTAAGGVAPAPAKGFQWISNDPADGAIILAGTKFDIAWRIKNTGTTTWNTSYAYAYFSGDKFFENSRYNLKGSVEPGKEVTVLVDAVAPSKSGTYYTWWKLINDQGQNLGDMDLRIVVVQANETPKVTATP